jgi:hypothetical protein
VLVEFMEHSLDRWKPNGGDVDPADDRRFHIADAVAIPGVADAAHALSNAPTDRMSIGADSGATIEIHDGEVRLGDNTASGDGARVALRSTLAEFMTVLSGVTDSAGACAALYAALQSANWPDDYCAQKVKAK